MRGRRVAARGGCCEAGLAACEAAEPGLDRAFARDGVAMLGSSLLAGAQVGHRSRLPRSEGPTGLDDIHLAFAGCRSTPRPTGQRHLAFVQFTKSA